MFLMGKSGQSFVMQNSHMKNNLHHMRQWSNGNIQLSLLKEHQDTFLFHHLQNDTSAEHAMQLGYYFNRQSRGLRVKDLQDDEVLKKIITPLATIYGSADIRTTHSFVNYTEFPYNENEEFIAIAEGIDLPIYMFTYNVEMT